MTRAEVSDISNSVLFAELCPHCDQQLSYQPRTDRNDLRPEERMIAVCLNPNCPRRYVPYFDL